MFFKRNLIYLLGAFKYINLNIDFKQKKDKKDCRIYLGINLEEIKDAL